MSRAQRGGRGPSVTVLESSISSIDAGGLRYRGFPVAELAAAATYEQVAWLLLTGAVADAACEAQIRADLATGSAVPAGVWDQLALLPEATPPVARMQAALPLLALSTPARGETAAIPGPRGAVQLLGAFATLVAGRPAPVSVDAGVAARFMAAVRGADVPPADVRALEQVLVLYADHELNASTFAGRVAASTKADMVSAVLAALCALRGPLHGGVDRFVRSLLAAAEQEGAASVLQRYVEAGSVVPGFGHSVYPGIDPRAVLMRDLARRIASVAGQGALLDLTEAVEAAAMHLDIAPANVDLYTVVVYRSLRIPDALSTLVFAMGRLAGWCAHILEQYADNRLIRPRAAYIGPGPRRWASGLEDGSELPDGYVDTTINQTVRCTEPPG